MTKSVKKNRIIAMVNCIIMVFAVLLSTIGYAEAVKSMNKYNVVFVTDTSGSMKHTDSEGYRFEAIDLFVGLISNGGNSVGSVVFGDGVVSKQDIREIKNKSDKVAITNDIKNQGFSDWTDIGGALTAAEDMLKSGGNKDLPSIIILLTDGNTDMSTPEAIKASIQNKENAMEQAREEGYKIFTICLNTNQKANPTELQQIAEATGGQFQEVTDAADLQNVFDLYYQMIYSTKTEKMVDEQIPGSGVLSREFRVADVGVEEVNIVVFGDVDRCALTKPDGTKYTDSEIDDISYVAKTFRILKIADPEPGEWRLDTYGKPGGTVKVFKIYNPNLQVRASIVDNQDSFVKDKPINFKVEILEGDVPVSEIQRYSGYTASMEIKDYNGNIVESSGADNPADGGFSLTFIPRDYGTYYADISVSNGELSAEAETLTVNVGNTAPIANTELLKTHINRWPFLLKTNSTIDLSEAATDAEDQTLNYRVVSSTWMEDDYTLEGANLTIDNFSVSKGSFTVAAYDSQGAYCTFDVKVTSTNIGLLAMILMMIAALILLITLPAIKWINDHRAFMGDITVQNLETGEVSPPTVKSRGRIKLTAFRIGRTGFNKKCYFQATGKKYIYFISKKPVASDSTYKKLKKIKIDSSLDVKIFSDAEQTKGISVRFESMLNNNF